MKKKYLITALLVLIFSALWNIYWNGRIVVHTYTHVNEDIPEVFDGFRIVQLTDIHSVRTESQGDLIFETVKAQKPDVICITGDLVDSRYYAERGIEGEKLTLELVKRLKTEVCSSIYFVYGNHEMILLDDPENNAFKRALEELNVHIVNNEVSRWGIQKGSGEIVIAGIQDPSTLYKDYDYAFLDSNAERMEAMMDEITSMEGINGPIKEEDFVILLSHRPEYFELYDQYPVDLCLTGHAHGGQFRLPALGGVYAPGQGFFPKYTAGSYASDDLEMLVGTGIGDSVIPFRIFNPPEILTIILETK